MTSIATFKWPNILVTGFVAFAWGVPTGSAADFSPIHGRWMAEDLGCVERNDIRRTITRTTVAAWETSCRILSSSAKGKTYTLKLECSSEGETWIDTSTFKLISRRVMTHGSTRYIRC